MSVTMFIAALVGLRFAARFDPKRVAQAGLALLCAGAVLLMGTIDVELDEAEFAVALALFGAGAGLLLWGRGAPGAQALDRRRRDLRRALVLVHAKTAGAAALRQGAERRGRLAG